MNAQHLPPEALDTWAAAAAKELDIESATIPIALILKVAADVAHGVARPGAPLSTFLLGIAVGRGDGSPEELEALATRLTDLARDWRTSEVREDPETP